MAVHQPDLAELTALTRAQDAVAVDFVRQAQEMAQNSITEITDWYDHNAIKDWAEGLSSRISVFMSVVARSADAYQARLVKAVTGATFEPAGAINVSDGIREGISHAGVYGRVADKFRFWQSEWDKTMIGLASGGPLPTAHPAELMRNRLNQIAESDILFTGRNQARKTLAHAADGKLVTGYRRVLHPELAHQGDCGLCIASSTRIYSVGTLMPMHGGCHCTPLPVTAYSDPGAAINDEDLVKYYRDAADQNGLVYPSTQAADLRKTRYRVDDHGEWGPVLAPEDAPIRTPKKVRKATNYVPGWTEKDEEGLKEAEDELNNLNEALSTLYRQQNENPANTDIFNKINSAERRKAALEKRYQKLYDRKAEAQRLAAGQQPLPGMQKAVEVENARKVRILQDKRDALEKAYFSGNPNDDRLTTEDYPWDAWHGDIRDRIDSLDHDIAEMTGDPLAGNLNGYPKIIGPHTMADDASLANPNWGGRDAPAYGYQINCINCVDTYELRRRGYRVQAQSCPPDRYGLTMGEILAKWRTPDGAVATIRGTDVGSSAAIRRQVDTWPTGGRGIVELHWRGSGGHVVNVEKDENGIHFIEPQEGYVLTDGEFDNTYARRAFGMRLYRVDDLRPSRVDEMTDFVGSSDDTLVNIGTASHGRDASPAVTPERARQRIHKLTLDAQNAVDTTTSPGDLRDGRQRELIIFKRAEMMTPEGIEEQYHDAMGVADDAIEHGDTPTWKRAQQEALAWQNALWEGWGKRPGDAGIGQGIPDVAQGVSTRPDLQAVIAAEGGFTYNPLTHGLLEVGKAKGFAVAVPGTEHDLGNGTISREQFETAIADLAETYRDEINNGAVIGGWYSPDRDQYMVELTEIVPDRAAAIKLGTERHQEAIFDLATGDTIGTGGTGDAVKLTGVPDRHAEAVAVATHILEQAQKAEATITPELEQFAAAHHAHMEGLDFRLKTSGSLIDKLERKSALKGLTPAEYGEKIADALRYTMVSTPEDYAANSQAVLDDFRRRGFDVIDVTNTWAPGSAYMGVNTNIRTPDGYVFELQFHTSQSWQVKFDQHATDYEIERNPANSPEVRQAAHQRMVDNFAAIVFPPGAEKVH